MSIFIFMLATFGAVTLVVAVTAGVVIATTRLVVAAMGRDDGDV